MKAVAIIQARLGSTRLPGKILRPVAGRPLLQHVIDRARAVQGLNHVVLNVPAADAETIRLAVGGVPIHGVPDQEADVLGSYVAVAEIYQADIVMRLTGDCPLLCPVLAYQVLSLYRRLDDRMAYCANDTRISGYPDGTDVEVVSTAALKVAAARATDAFDREHVMPWLRRHSPCYTIVAPFGLDLTGEKWSVDTPKDLDYVRRLFAADPPGLTWWHTVTAALELRKGATE